MIQIFFDFDSHVRGSNISDGKIIFSIVGGLGFEHSPFRKCLILLLIG